MLNFIRKIFHVESRDKSPKKVHPRISSPTFISSTVMPRFSEDLVVGPDAPFPHPVGEVPVPERSNSLKRPKKRRSLQDVGVTVKPGPNGSPHLALEPFKKPPSPAKLLVVFEDVTA